MTSRRMREFSRFDLAWWIDSITPILDEFVAAAEGQVHHEFWESIYKFEGPQRKWRGTTRQRMGGQVVPVSPIARRVSVP